MFIQIQKIATYDLDRKKSISFQTNHSDITTYSHRLSFATFLYSLCSRNQNCNQLWEIISPAKFKNNGKFEHSPQITILLSGLKFKKYYYSVSCKLLSFKFFKVLLIKKASRLTFVIYSDRV